MVGVTDDVSTRAVLAALHACPATTREAVQATDGIINPSTGQPVGRGEMIVAFGGDSYQKVTGYLESKRTTPIYPAYSSASSTWQYKKSTDDSVVASLASSQIGATHDLIVVELIRDTATGVPIILGYGIDVSGTKAAAWYFINVIMTSLSSFSANWYVLEWIDDGVTGPSDAGEYTVRGSG